MDITPPEHKKCNWLSKRNREHRSSAWSNNNACERQLIHECNLPKAWSCEARQKEAKEGGGELKEWVGNR
jgi:hypothetical protein